MERNIKESENKISSEEIEKNSIEQSDDFVTRLVQKTRDTIFSSISEQNTFFTKSLLKGIVSKKKLRFEFDGFDLDLSYITPNIIAMGFPSNSIEKIYRNGEKEVLRFFEKRHNNNYKVYNLCSERQYPADTFQKQAYFPFDDHEAPPFSLMLPFCEDMHLWLTENEKNISAVHCKAGKGRTGTMICCYLLYSNVFTTAEECLKYYGIMRTENKKGVTIPSQLRYVFYFAHCLRQYRNHQIPFPLKFPNLMLSKIKISPIPSIHKYGSKCTPYFIIENEGSKYNYKKKNKLHSYKHETHVEFKIPNFTVSGDVKITFLNSNTIGKEKIFKFWFNTFFIQEDGNLIIKKSMLDKAVKDKDSKIFEPNFNVEISTIILNENFDLLESEREFNSMKV
jgi:phosphatidylinositol-3,4,5-trisphosphate 3-phosphatase/dual-specificity protein phosphatase PTEN